MSTLTPALVLQEKLQGWVLESRPKQCIKELLRDDDTDTLLSSHPNPGSWCRNYDYVYIYTWADDRTVQDVLHKGTKKDWKRCNKTSAYSENVKSTVDGHRNLTKKAYRALVYSLDHCFNMNINGDHDMLIPYVGTHDWIESLNLTIKLSFGILI
uniref:Uncharacterized protein n=1 Tax=Populus trichocarpa TaxID=3694 RepID=U5G0G3_POPTR